MLAKHCDPAAVESREHLGSQVEVLPDCIGRGLASAFQLNGNAGRVGLILGAGPQPAIPGDQDVGGLQGDVYRPGEGHVSLDVQEENRRRVLINDQVPTKGNGHVFSCLGLAIREKVCIVPSFRVRPQQDALSLIHHLIRFIGAAAGRAELGHHLERTVLRPQGNHGEQRVVVLIVPIVPGVGHKGLVVERVPMLSVLVCRVGQASVVHGNGRPAVHNVVALLLNVGGGDVHPRGVVQKVRTVDPYLGGVHFHPRAAGKHIPVQPVVFLGGNHKLVPIIIVVCEMDSRCFVGLFVCHQHWDEFELVRLMAVEHEAPELKVWATKHAATPEGWRSVHTVLWHALKQLVVD
mmetsp:Transcript_25557/g.69341  ORF Transcript_25557/g.69341 Transcript_25557/m.69341 type:complete len:349 (-) Transcript_25557:840-1886(-)